MCIVQLHQDCYKHIVFYDKVSQLIDEISNFEIQFELLVSDVNELLEKTKKAFVNASYPITLYQTCPNLKNLNLLGDLLKTNSTNKLSQLISQTQKVISEELTRLFQSIKSMGPKALPQESQNLQFKEAVKLVEEYTKQLNQKRLTAMTYLENKFNQKDSEEKLFKEYKELCRKDSAKALDIIERVIQLAPKNQEYLKEKGQCLKQLNRNEDSLEFFNKSISIEPTSTTYQCKAHSLYELNKLQEAMICLEEALVLFPNDINLSGLLMYFRSKLDQ